MTVLASMWMDGALVPSAEAKVSAVDHGLTVGDGIFETMKVVGNDAFAVSRHLARLRRSADRLRLVVPYDDRALRAAISSVIEANTDAGRIRLTVTGGPGPMGSARGDNAATVIVAASPLTPFDDTVDVTLVPWKRNEYGALAGIKSTSYAENVIALEYAHRHRSGEAIFANTADRLCEGTGTNIFLGVDGRLITPPLSAGCLAGITRELVLEVVEVTERDLPITSLGTATEAFLTSSTRDVQAIRRIDDRDLPECPGPLTLAAAEALAALVERTTDP